MTWLWVALTVAVVAATFTGAWVAGGRQARVVDDRPGTARGALDALGRAVERPRPFADVWHDAVTRARVVEEGLVEGLTDDRMLRHLGRAADRVADNALADLEEGRRDD